MGGIASPIDEFNCCCRHLAIYGFPFTIFPITIYY
jgi:hypothetical protein